MRAIGQVTRVMPTEGHGWIGRGGAVDIRFDEKDLEGGLVSNDALRGRYVSYDADFDIQVGYSATRVRPACKPAPPTHGGRPAW